MAGLCMRQALGLMLAGCVTIGNLLILFLCEKHHLLIAAYNVSVSDMNI